MKVEPLLTPNPQPLMHELHMSQYERQSIDTGIIHVGIGAFHRAHQAYYIDKLLELGHKNWGIAGVNLRAGDDALIHQLQQRDCQYILKTIAQDNTQEYREIRAINALYNWSEHQEEALNLFTLNTTELVTITVTESGYSFNEDFQLNIKADEIQAELNGTSNTCTIYRYLREGLHKRRLSNNKPISILCCDNLRYNGKFLQQSFQQYLTLCNDDMLLEWLQSHVSFPSCMVDRITPALNVEQMHETQKLFARHDDSTVIAEDFAQWVIEDNFIAARPPLDTVDVQYTHNIEQYEEVKIRILNGSHTALCYLGALKGYAYFDETLQDGELAQFFDNLQDDEIIPALGDNMPINLHQYKETVKKRFANTHIRDTIARICMDGASKISIYLLPTIKQCFDKSITPINAIRVIASWYVFMQKYQNDQIDFEYIEPKWDSLQPYLGPNNLEHFIHSSELWGDIVQQNPEFCDYLKQQIIQLERLYRD